jgi:hypothetical protein
MPRQPKVTEAPPIKALIGRTEGPDEDYGGPNFFAVTLTPELARLVIQRWLLWRQARAQDDQLYELWFWDYHANWLDSFGTKSLPEEVVERLDDESPDGGGLFWPEGEVVPYVGDEYQARVECPQMAVGDNDVKWTCYPKHGRGEYSTGQVPLASFLVALAEQKLPGDAAVADFAAQSHNADECAMFLDYLKERLVLT